jgi:hypothetical protein
MSIKEIETAITQLPANELAKLSTWFENYLSQMWDKQIHDDLEAGRLDRVLEEVGKEHAAGLSRPLL